MLLLYLLAVVVVAVVGGVVPALLAAVGVVPAGQLVPDPALLHVRGGKPRQLIDAGRLRRWSRSLVSVTVELAARTPGGRRAQPARGALLSRLSAAEISGASLTAVLDQVRGLFGMTIGRAGGPRRRRHGAAGARSARRRRRRPSLTVDAGRGLRLVAARPGALRRGPPLLGGARQRTAVGPGRTSSWPSRPPRPGSSRRSTGSAPPCWPPSATTCAPPWPASRPRSPACGRATSTWTRRRAARAAARPSRSPPTGSTDLISNLLAMSRLQAGALSVAHQRGRARRGRRARAARLGPGDGRHRRRPEDLPLVQADAGLLERVVANLVDNARRFTPGTARSTRPGRRAERQPHGVVPGSARHRPRPRRRPGRLGRACSHPSNASATGHRRRRRPRPGHRPRLHRGHGHALRTRRPHPAAG